MALEPMINATWGTVTSSPGCIFKILRANMEMVQKRNNMVNPLPNTLIILIQKATCVTSPKAKKEKTRPNNKKKGAPGGWGTISLYETAINSPQSQ